ncbi:MAG: ROK family protein, partial [Rivularia sp. (in: cyanobacteria)]
MISTTEGDNYVIGIDAGGTRIRIAVACQTEIIAQWTGDLPLLQNAKTEIQFILDAITNLLSKAKINVKSLQGIGLATAAIVDRLTGVVICWPNRPYWQGIPLRELFHSVFPVPLYIEDDANAAAFGELRFGNGKGYQSLAYITVSTGIGCGLVLQEKIYTGEHGWAGEIGHTTAVYNGAICTCGKSGCLQAEASGKAIARKWLEKANVNYKNIDGSFVAAQAASGDILARDIFKEAATLVGIS